MTPESWALLRDLFERARQKFEAGDQTLIMRCMFFCMLWKIHPPEWLREAFLNRVGAPWRFESWDDAFGPPMPKGTKKARREEMENEFRLVIKIALLRKRGVKGDDLFKQAAKDLRIARDWQTVRDAYYRIEKSSRTAMEANLLAEEEDIAFYEKFLNETTAAQVFVESRQDKTKSS